jgi:hypothetical protein
MRPQILLRRPIYLDPMRCLSLGNLTTDSFRGAAFGIVGQSRPPIVRIGERDQTHVGHRTGIEE